MVICLVGSWVASSDKVVCLINTLTAALSGQSHSSSLLKWLRKSLWPLGDWYSNFPPASQMICPEMRQTKCDCLSFLLSFSLISSFLSPFSLPCSLRLCFTSVSFLPLPFSSPSSSSLSLQIGNVISHAFSWSLFFSLSLQWSLKIALAAGNADFCFLHHFSINNETFWLVKTASDSSTGELSFIGV